MDDLLRALARERGAATARFVREGAGQVIDVLLQAFPQAKVTTLLVDEPVSCPDLRSLGAQARSEGWALLVDATICGVGGCAAERLGAHASVVGLGHDVCLLTLSRDAARACPDLEERVRILPSWEVSLSEASERVEATCAYWHKASDEAQVVAAYLRCHPRVRELRYPGLRGDPSFEVAARTLQGGFGPHVDYRLDDSPDWHRVRCMGDDPKMTVMGLEQTLRRGA